MTSRAIAVAGIALTCVGGAWAAAPRVLCHEADGTLQQTCVDVANVTENGSLRAAPVYIGGPKSVDKTNFVMVADCAKQIATMQDSKGVNFAGGMSSQTAASRALTAKLCAAKPARKDSALRQF
jgi:hypothetical protein